MKALAITWLTAWREAWANRRGFWTQVTVMVVNDVVWILFWVLFFHRVGTVRGWNVDELLVLLAVLTTSAGVVLGLLNNARRVGDLAATGGLDAALSLPTPTLLHLLCRRIDTSNVGDLIFGIVLFIARCNPTPQRSAFFALGVLCATLTITGFLVLMGSLSFFVGRNEAGDLGFHALLLFSSYPVDIFAGATKVFLYAVVPAGFVSASPARLVDHFDLARAMGMLGIGIAFVTAGSIAFTLGLRRYTSGAVWTRA
jgi:ABC-2 type transport system permease protein